MTRRLKSFVLAIPLVVLVLLGAVAAYSRLAPSPTADPPVAVVAPPPPEATPEEVHRLCASCHAYPPPTTFPRSSWRKEVKQAYDFLRDSPLHLPYPSLESVVRYYESRAPEELPGIHRGQPPDPPALRYEKRGY